MKALLIIVAAFAATVVMLFVAPFIVPSSHYKDAIVSQIKEHIDAEVSIEDFSFEILPYPAFTLRGFNILATKAPFQNVPVFQANTIVGGLSPSALLRGKFITDLVIQNPILDDRVATDGTSSLSLLVAQPAVTQVQAEPHEQHASIRSLTITNGTFRLIKEGETEPFVIDHLEGVTSEITARAAISTALRLSADIEGQVKQKAILSGKISFDPHQKLLEGRQLDIFFAGARLSADASFRYDTKAIDAHVATPSITLPSLATLVPSLAQGLPFGIEMTGPMALDITLNGTKENLETKLHIDATASRIRCGSILTKEQNLPLKMVFAGRYQPAYITIDDVAFSFGDAAFHLMGSVVNQPGYPAQLTLSSTSFDARLLKSYFPFLTIFDELTNPSMTISVQGMLLDETARTISGHLASEKAATLGYTLSNFETDFQYAGNVIALNTLKGVLYNGLLSGNGSIDLKSIPTIHAECVIDNLDTTKITTLPAVLSGTASLVIKADAAGMDGSSLKASFASEGTMLLPDGEISPFKVGRQIFIDPLWKILGPYVPGGLDEQAKSALSAIEGDVKDLKISFNMKNGIVTMPRVEWSHPHYQAVAKGSVGLQGEVVGDGNLYLSKDDVVRLVKDPQARKVVTTNLGTLDIPFIVSGTVMAMAIRPDDAKLADNFKRTTTPATTPIVQGLPPVSPPPPGAAIAPSPPTAPEIAPSPPAALPPPVAAIPSPTAPAVAPSPPTAQPPPPAVSTPPTEVKEAPQLVAPSPKKTVKKKSEVAKAAPEDSQEQPSQPSKKKTQKTGSKRGKMTTEEDENVMKVIIGQ